MCTHPLIINRKFAGKTRTDIVPCGKCHECISKKQNEFAALACLEAKRSSSMWFATLTYSNRSCPIMESYTLNNTLYSSFVEDVSIKESLVSAGAFSKNTLTPQIINGKEYIPSLRREDFRLFVKRFRVAYERQFGEKICMRYACFGEYGDHTHRPHYHCLFYGLSDSQAHLLSDAWTSQFGFSDFRKIPIVNLDGSSARVKVSKYVSKYLSKLKHDFPALLEGKVEAPRRISSASFGVGVIDEQIRSFIYAKI